MKPAKSSLYLKNLLPEESDQAAKSNAINPWWWAMRYSGHSSQQKSAD